MRTPPDRAYPAHWEADVVSLRADAELGVHQIQVRPRSRSWGQLIDRLAAFGQEGAPLLLE